MALKRVWIPSPNYSSRGGAGVRLIVIHTAEGATTIESLGSWFQNRSGQVSSHTGADDKVNTVGEYVKRDNKAWTASNANPVAVQIELCAFASWSSSEWSKHPNMLANCAAWIAEEAAHYGIPITKLSSSQAQGGGRGVCQHADLGSWGGGHWDCGSSFPMDQVLDMARGGSPAPAPSTSEEDQVAVALNWNDAIHVFELYDDAIWYTWQNKGETSWNGGKSGSGPAGMSRFCPAQDVVSISAERSASGALTLIGKKKNGSLVYTWQKSGQNGWNGGEKGKQVAGFVGFAPAPK
jgi:hypothetical protein